MTIAVADKHASAMWRENTAHHHIFPDIVSREKEFLFEVCVISSFIVPLLHIYVWPKVIYFGPVTCWEFRGRLLIRSDSDEEDSPVSETLLFDPNDDLQLLEQVLRNVVANFGSVSRLRACYACSQRCLEYSLQLFSLIEGPI